MMSDVDLARSQYIYRPEITILSPELLHAQRLSMKDDGHGDMIMAGCGSLDWWCVPRFDSPSVFGRVLDPDTGCWAIARPASSRSSVATPVRTGVGQEDAAVRLQGHVVHRRAG
jgi:hypothetical protein